MERAKITSISVEEAKRRLLEPEAAAGAAAAGCAGAGVVGGAEPRAAEASASASARAPGLLDSVIARPLPWVVGALAAGIVVGRTPGALRGLVAMGALAARTAAGSAVLPAITRAVMARAARRNAEAGAMAPDGVCAGPEPVRS